MIPTKKQNPKGLHQKYVIRKVVGIEDVPNSFGHRKWLKTEAVKDNAEYFVLRLDLNDLGKDVVHRFACRKAIQTYANEIEDVLPQLAADLRERYPVND
jgi:hypothetical protein